MRRNKLLTWVAIAAILMGLPVAMAATPGGGSASSVQDKGEYPGSSPSTVSVEAGNITYADISGEQSTYHWAGIYGNATGTLVLGDSSSNKMYEWSAKAKYVYFDDDNSITWGSLVSVACSDVEGVYTFLSGASDNCASTFTTTRDFYSTATGDSVTGAIAAQTYDGGSPQTPTWYTIALGDGGTSDIVFAGEVDNSYTNTAYDGTPVNYQTILPENGESGDTTATTHYIWIELY